MAINNARTYFDDEENGEELSQENIDRTLREVDEIEGREGRYDEMAQRSIADAEADAQAAAESAGARYVPPEEQKEFEAKQAPQAAAAPAEPAQNLTPLSDAERKAIAEGPHNVMAAGSGGLIRNKTTPDVAKRAEEKAQMRAAMRAAKDAEAAKRQELLASGRYYDDGRGNIKLRKDYMGKRRRANGRGETEIYNDQSWQTALDIQNAGKEAYDRAMGIVEETPAAKSAAKTRATVNANRAALTAEELEQKQRKMNTAKGHLAIFDGLAAAYDALRQNNPEEAEEETKLVFNKTDAQGRDGRWKYDEQGRIVGQADAVRVKTGKRFMNGYVAPDVIRTINDNLAQRGNDKYRITGILARQGVDAIGVARGEPIFYVQGKRADGSAFMKTMTLKDAYRFGVESGTESGLFADYAEQNVIDALGDVFGVDRRKNAPTEKERIASGENASREKIAQMDAENKKEIAKLKSDTDKEIAAMGGKSGKRGYTLDERLKIIEAETERQLKVAKAKKESGEQVQAIRTYASLLKDPVLRARLEKLDDDEANKFVETLAAVMGLGENAAAQSQDENPSASAGAQRSAAEIRANPQDGDELPLKGGGKARYNGKTGKWEAAN